MMLNANPGSTWILSMHVVLSIEKGGVGKLTKFEESYK